MKISKDQVNYYIKQLAARHNKQNRNLWCYINDLDDIHQVFSSIIDKQLINKFYNLSMISREESLSIMFFVFINNEYYIYYRNIHNFDYEKDNIMTNANLLIKGYDEIFNVLLRMFFYDNFVEYDYVIGDYDSYDGDIGDDGKDGDIGDGKDDDDFIDNPD